MIDTRYVLRVVLENGDFEGLKILVSEPGQGQLYKVLNLFLPIMEEKPNESIDALKKFHLVGLKRGSSAIPTSSEIDLAYVLLRELTDGTYTPESLIEKLGIEKPKLNRTRALSKQEEDLVYALDSTDTRYLFNNEVPHFIRRIIEEADNIKHACSVLAVLYPKIPKTEYGYFSTYVHLLKVIQASVPLLVKNKLVTNKPFKW